MDPQTDLPDLVEDLEVNIDELSDALQPLLSTPLHTTVSSLPLLDKAKLYVLAAYAIESLLFSTLQASEINAKEHAIFKELARLKGYFGKVKEIEERGQQPKQKLDVGAAQRFIKHGLAGNDKYDLERAERLAKEKARAAIKARQINKKFDEEGIEKTEDLTPKKRVVEEVVAGEEDKEEVLGGLEEGADTPAEPATKKARVSSADLMEVDSVPSPTSQSSTTGKKDRKKRGRKAKSSAENTDAEEQEQAEDETSNVVEDADADVSATAPKKKQRQKKNTRKSRQSPENSSAEDTQAAPAPAPAAEENTRPKRTPKTRSETSNPLPDASAPEKPKSTRGRGRGKGRGK